jgi:hypothetical protein
VREVQPGIHNSLLGKRIDMAGQIKGDAVLYCYFLGKKHPISLPKESGGNS